MGPTTTLDARFSDPAAVAVSWDKTGTLLEASELFWVCTVRPDGRPHATLFVAVWVDEAVYSRTGTIEQKFANLSNNPHVVLLTGCNQWDGGIDVVMEGNAARVTDPAVVERLATAWVPKWDGRWESLSEVFSVVPSTLYAYAKGDPFGQTKHRF